jgi:3-dehydroquinate synthase
LLARAAEYVKTAVRAKSFAIITDDTVDALYGGIVADSLRFEGFRAVKFAFPHGEASKSLRTLGRVYDFLSGNNITRSDCIVALGGGVVGDTAGFAAATFLRGIDYIQIPTTLLAQVDSSVGGKTAVDLPAGKNLVGAFWQPRMVLLDIDALETLPEEFFIDGLGEVVKYGMIKSKTLFETLERHDLESVRGVLPDIIRECVAIKKASVEADEFDTGERMLLNFGHTLGHAIEKLTNYSGVSHGRAVAAGMKIVTRAAEEAGFAVNGLTDRLTACLERYRLNADVPFTPIEIASACGGDKKRSGGEINIVVCRDAGESELRKFPFEEFLRWMSIDN